MKSHCIVEAVVRRELRAARFASQNPQRRERGGRLSGTLIVLTAGVLAACGHQSGIVKTATPVRVGAIQELSAGGGVRYSANIAPREQVAVAFKVAGYVKEIAQRRGSDGRMRPLQAGDHVQRGAMLARLREDDYAQVVAQARSSLAGAKAAQGKAAADKSRAEGLHASKSLTRADYDSAVAAYDSGLARVEGADAQLRQSEISLADCVLGSPLDGVVLERRIESGSLVGSGSVAFVVADLSSVKAVFGVPDLVVGTLKPGGVLRVTTDALRGADFEGRLTSVSPAADSQSRVFNIELTIPNRSQALKAGMIATVSVNESGAADVKHAVVPLSAIVRSSKDPSGYAVFVLDGEGETPSVLRRDVRLGEVYGNLIAISSDLKGSERVVITGASMLADGERVQVVP